MMGMLVGVMGVWLGSLRPVSAVLWVESTHVNIISIEVK